MVTVMSNCSSCKKQKQFLKRANKLTIKIGSASKFSVISLPQKKHRTIYAPFTRGREQVYIYKLTFWKYEHFHEFKSLRQNGFTNDLHKNEFCSCFMNEAQVVFLLVFLLTYIVGSRSWFWEQCWWTWLWKSKWTVWFSWCCIHF